jgi:hypothetical protein
MRPVHLTFEAPIRVDMVAGSRYVDTPSIRGAFVTCFFVEISFNKCPPYWANAKYIPAEIERLIRPIAHRCSFLRTVPGLHSKLTTYARWVGAL